MLNGDASFVTAEDIAAVGDYTIVELTDQLQGNMEPPAEPKAPLAPVVVQPATVSITTCANAAIRTRVARANSPKFNINDTPPPYVPNPAPSQSPPWRLTTSEANTLRQLRA